MFGSWLWLAGFLKKKKKKKIFGGSVPMKYKLLFSERDV